MNENIFDKLDFGPLRALLDNDDITDISFDNGGQIWIRSLEQGSMRVEVEGVTQEFIEKLAFQCSNVMGTTFNNAKPFLDAESAELRLNFVHSSIATNGIAMVIRKTPAKIRLEKEKLLKEDYFTQDIHDVLIKCVEGHCNIIVAGETGSGKTEFVKYLASHTKTEEKIITIEDTLELHLDKIFPQRDIVSMKTNNIASYTDVLVTCMRQNPKWILLSEVRSAEAVTAVRNSISSGHNILSTIHADKASAIPYRLYSLMETDLDVNQFLTTIYRYVQIGVHIRAYYSKKYQKFHREVDEVVEFYVDDDNVPRSRTLYQKMFGKEPVIRRPSDHLIEYLENQNIDINSITAVMPEDVPFANESSTNEEQTEIGTENIPVDNNVPVDTTVPIDGGAGLIPQENPVAIENTVVAQPEVQVIPMETPIVTPVDITATQTVLPEAVSTEQQVSAPGVTSDISLQPTYQQPITSSAVPDVTGQALMGVLDTNVLNNEVVPTYTAVQPQISNLEVEIQQPVISQSIVTPEQPVVSQEIPVQPVGSYEALPSLSTQEIPEQGAVQPIQPLAVS